MDSIPHVRFAINRLARRFLAVLGAALLVDIAAMVALMVLAVLAYQPHVIARLPRADAVAIFYTSEQPDLGLRLQAARDILQAEKARDVVCLGGARPRRRYYGCEDIINGLARSGIARDRLVADRSSNDSASNVEALDRIAREREYRSIILVSDSLHLLRLSPDVRRMTTTLAISSYASGLGGHLNILRRAQWEVAAWLLRPLPREVRHVLIRMTR
mgnify:CR=1 FL=1